MDFGERLKKVRKETGLTQKEFAAAIGVTRSPIASAESGKSKLQPMAIRKICELYNINGEWLQTGEGSMRNTYNIPDDELKNLLEVYSKLPESLRKKLISFLEELINLYFALGNCEIELFSQNTEKK